MTEKVSKKISEWAKELGVKSPDLFRLLQEAGVEDAKSTMTVVSSDAIDSVREAVSALSAKSKKKATSSKASASKACAKKSAAETDAKKDAAEAEAKPKAKTRGTKTTTQTKLADGFKVKVTRTRPTKVQPETEEKKEEGSKSADKKASAAASGAKSEAKKAAASKASSDEKKGDAKSTEKTASPATAKKTVKSVEPPAEAGKENAQGTVISTSKSSDAPPQSAPAAKPAVVRPEKTAFKAVVEKPTEEFAARIARYQQTQQRRTQGGTRPPRRDGPGFTGAFGRPASTRGSGEGRSSGGAGYSGSPRVTGPSFASGGGSGSSMMAPPAPDTRKAGGHGSGPRGSAKKRQKAPEQREREERFDPKQSVNRVMASLSKSTTRHHYERRSSGTEEEEVKRELKVSDFITVSELAGLLGVSSAQVVAKCMELGMMVTINYRIDFDTIQLVASEFGYDAKLMDEYEDIEGEEEAQNEEALVPRPPVVTVMGHADHGKTSLLDYVRKTRIAKGEAGGITQHIGAYQVETSKGRVTFLDTPGHEAFSQMRARGSQITDVIVLVIAADSMVMPQTVESIEHARSANVPIVVAITKSDLETANPDRIRAQLSERGVEVEQWGGKTSCVEVSSKSGMGMDTLLETLALEAEILDLKANPDMPARAVVIESRLDKGKGALATVLVQNGTLRVGDAFAVGNYAGRVRALLDETGEQLKEVGPGCPCQIMGLDGAPFAGDRLTVYENEKEAREIASKRRAAAKERELRSHQRKQMSDVVAKSGELKVIIKADVDGSAEALTQELEKLSNKEVVVNIIRKAVGNINESDVQLAAASDAVIVAFHLLPAPAVREMAERAGVEIKMYRIIYDCIEEFQGLVEAKLKPIIREEVAGEAEVKQIYRIPKVGLIAGCIVTNGVVDLEAKLRVYRNGREVGVAVVSSLKRHQESVTSVKVGLECGIGIDGFDDLQVDDTLAFFKEVKIKRTLKDVES